MAAQTLPASRCPDCLPCRRRGAERGRDRRPLPHQSRRPARRPRRPIAFARPELPRDPHRRRAHRGHDRCRAPEDRVADACDDRDPVHDRRRRPRRRQGRGHRQLPARGGRRPIVATFDGVDIEQIVDLEAGPRHLGRRRADRRVHAVEQLRRADIPVLVSYPTDHRWRARRASAHRLRRSGSATTADDPRRRPGAAHRRTERLLASAAATSRASSMRSTSPAGSSRRPTSRSTARCSCSPAASRSPATTSYSISLEELVDADPEVILLGDAAYGVTAEAVAERPGWKRHDGRQERGHLPDRRHPRHPTRAAARRGPRGARSGRSTRSSPTSSTPRRASSACRPRRRRRSTDDGRDARPAVARSRAPVAGQATARAGGALPRRPVRRDRCRCRRGVGGRAAGRHPRDPRAPRCSGWTSA